jgi:Fe-S oxidoreductase
MATYKAEFLSHHFKGRLRPRADYAITLIYWWARLATRVPRLVNLLTHAPGISRLVKRIGGVAQQRTIPRFATETFTHWFERRPGTAVIAALDRPQHAHGQKAPFETDRVLLWPDTFNNYLESSVLQAAVEVIEDAGYLVEIPPRPLCCGRPLYDAGMLSTAERLWKQILETLRPWIRAGIPVVGLEPSCVAAFRDELVNLFPHDDDAKRLSEQTLMLSEFLERQGYSPPELSASAIVHPHCHHHSVIGMDAEVAVLKRMGVDYELLDSGCCGMAGSFGFNADKYEVSMRVGERVLLPRVRELDAGSEVLTDGFSCREQIEQGTSRTPLHLAQLIQRAIHERDAAKAGEQ